MSSQHDVEVSRSENNAGTYCIQTPFKMPIEGFALFAKFIFSILKKQCFSSANPRSLTFHLLLGFS